MAHHNGTTRTVWRFTDLDRNPDLQALALELFECTEGMDVADAIEAAIRIHPRALAYAAAWDARALAQRLARNGREAA